MNSKLSILDCTLRDGGYCNKWDFGKKNITKIMNALLNSNIDIVECGFLTNKVHYDPNVSKFTSLEQVDNIIPNMDSNQKFVVMINFGEYHDKDIPMAYKTRIDGIRVAFHKKNMDEALNFAKKIKDKGYALFLQPMVTQTYSDIEFLNMIQKVNELLPYAFYIVDSFGTMRRRDLLHYLNLVEKNLSKDIFVGFHSHNNFQSAFSNALCLLGKNKEHSLIIDTSIYGMGRGAGNLNSELFLNELNKEYGMNYNVKPILQVMDEVINKFYEEKPWGYSLSNYLSAAYMIHPNYAIYLANKNTLTVDAIDDIFSSLDKEKAVEFDQSYIEKAYEVYMSKGHINNERIEEIKKLLLGRHVLLIAPGKSANNCKDKIKSFVNEKEPIVISVNHNYLDINTDFVFISNMRRFREIDKNVYNKTLVTTNINVNNTYASFDYFSLINHQKTVKDNAGLMLIQLLINMDCSDVYLAGFDGYEYNLRENYENKDMTLYMSNVHVDELNEGMKQVFDEYRNKIKLHFVTESRFANEGECE